MCVEGQCPDLPALRLEQVPAFPTIALTELRVAMAPAADKPAAVKWKHSVDKNDEKGGMLSIPKFSLFFCVIRKVKRRYDPGRFCVGVAVA